MDASARKPLLLAAAIGAGCVCCTGVLGYDDLGFQEPGEMAHWSPVDGATGYEVSAQDVPPPLNPTCGESTVALLGELEGTQANACFPRSWHTVNQATSPSSMDVEFGTEGKVHLEWNGLLPDGMGTAVTGTLKMPAEGPLAGKQYCVNAGSFAMFEVGLGERLFAFSLTTLASGATCPGTAVTGSLQGDFRTQ